MDTSAFIVSTPSALVFHTSPTSQCFRGHPTISSSPKRWPSRIQFTKMSAQTPQSQPQPPENVISGPIKGMYGNYYITSDDIDEVTRYRLSLTVMSFLQTGALVLSGSSLSVPQFLPDIMFFLSTAAFGVALQNIHIYAKPMHNLLKVFWASGLFGAIVIFLKALTVGETMSSYALWHPEAMLALGWQFVALTGLFVKEALCYGQNQAYALIAVTPAVCLAHLFGIGDFKQQLSAGFLYAGLFMYFCALKLRQSPVEDLGDLSVFQYLAAEREKQ